MSDTGILVIQHGDFPFDFIEKERAMYERVEGVMQRLSEKAKTLDHSPENDPHAADMRTLADAVRNAGYDVEIGYLDFALPAIGDAVNTLAARGHRNIVIACSPGLMMRSSHSLIDLPRVLREIMSARPELELAYAKPGIPYDLYARAMGKKINTVLGRESPGAMAMAKASRPGTAVVLVGHGDVPRDFIMQNMGVMKEAEEHAARWSETVRDWPRTEDNDPNYYDTLVLVTKLREMFWPVPVEIGYLEFARPSIGESFDKLTAAGNKKIVVLGGTGFFDRSSHTLIDIPEAIERLKKRRPDVEITYAYPDIGLVKDDLARAVAFKVERALDGDVLPL
ncbi:MAG: sirohydrochlorin cobaltochelatase [Methanocella sp. PtaU1.Bin125]|nr:MAG: sirohydrochlorin cobaltochelatase [Methanocella sp. PtaU1.Bin125]